MKINADNTRTHVKFRNFPGEEFSLSYVLYRPGILAFLQSIQTCDGDHFVVLGYRIKDNCPLVGLGPCKGSALRGGLSNGSLPIIREFRGKLGKTSNSYVEKHDRGLIWHIRSTSFESRTARPLVRLIHREHHRACKGNN